MKVSCPHCPAVYSIPDEKAPFKVKKVNCKKCGGVMEVFPLDEGLNLDETKTAQNIERKSDAVPASEGVNTATEMRKQNNDEQAKSTSFVRDSFQENVPRAIGRFILRLISTIIIALLGFLIHGIFLVATPFFLIWTFIGLVPRLRGLCPSCEQDSMNILMVNNKEVLECPNCKASSIYDEDTKSLHQWKTSKPPATGGFFNRGN